MGCPAVGIAFSFSLYRLESDIYLSPSEWLLPSSEEILLLCLRGLVSYFSASVVQFHCCPLCVTSSSTESAMSCSLLRWGGEESAPSLIPCVLDGPRISLSLRGPSLVFRLADMFTMFPPLSGFGVCLQGFMVALCVSQGCPWLRSSLTVRPACFAASHAPQSHVLLLPAIE